MTMRGFAAQAVAMGLCAAAFAACGGGGTTGTASTVVPAPPSAAATAPPTAMADAATAAYAADVQAEHVKLSRVGAGYGLSCAGDQIPTATVTKCGETAAAMKPLITEFLVHLAAAHAPARLADVDTKLRDVLNRMLPAVDAVLAVVASGRPGSLPRDLIGLQSELSDTVDSVATAASA